MPEVVEAEVLDAKASAEAIEAVRDVPNALVRV
jgi:hypothetical protein